MNSKTEIIAALRDQLDRWERYLAGLSEEEITAPLPPSDQSIRDHLVHLWAWQQRTLARNLAALRNTEPDYPAWSRDFGLDSEEDTDRVNAHIDEIYRDKPWPEIHADWKSQFQRILDLSEQIPGSDLFDRNRYGWMEGHPLSLSLLGTREHHEEHLGWLQGQQG